ncbi:uncharacterized protein TNCV_2746221 [Trichonephila clavipes]|nr:uncharacterized protein TNCV_2746221 [Trichonephila clavipes]
MGKTNLLSEKEDTVMMVISMERENLTKLNVEETVRINAEGRYEVSLPWKENHFPIPSNKEIGMKRLKSLTKKFHQETLFTAYDYVFKEWELLGIIENDPVDSSSHLYGHYLPHRHVVKQHGTTKIRPVFDASARQVGSPSLNQCLESGPNLLELIPNLLLRFGEHKYGIVADIEKAFLQISVQPEDIETFSISLFLFWRNGKENVVPKTMRHTRVVFGVKSNPFLLEDVLEHHLKKYLKNLKYSQRTVDILLRSFYVDDLITSLDNEADILPFIEESHHILAEGKLNLRG